MNISMMPLSDEMKEMVKEITQLPDGKLSYENSKRFLERQKLIDKQFEKLLCQSVFPDRKEAIKAINEVVIMSAKQLGCSVYDLCLKTRPVVIPRYEFDEKTMRQNVVYEFFLEPLDFELEKDGGYWKEKYFRLKKTLQGIVDNKED